MSKLISVLVIGAWAFGLLCLNIASISAAPAFATRTSDVAEVRVAVTPKALGPGAKVWEFEIVMDTHSKPLNENLGQLTVLVDDAGRRHLPIGWQGDAPGGHHRKGILRFEAPTGTTTAIELQIASVGGSGTRTFRWELK